MAAKSLEYKRPSRKSVGERGERPERPERTERPERQPKSKATLFTMQVMTHTIVNKISECEKTNTAVMKYGENIDGKKSCIFTIRQTCLTINERVWKTRYMRIMSTR